MLMKPSKVGHCCTYPDTAAQSHPLETYASLAQDLRCWTRITLNTRVCMCAVYPFVTCLYHQQFRVYVVMYYKRYIQQTPCISLSNGAKSMHTTALLTRTRANEQPVSQPLPTNPLVCALQWPRDLRMFAVLLPVLPPA